MKTVLYSFIMALLFWGTFPLKTEAAASQIVDGKEYYFYNIYYDRVLGQKTDNTAPGISKAGTNVADSYVFVAEASGTNGYFLLKQKSSGRYLAASTTNPWSVLLSATKATTDPYLWSIKSGTDGYLSCKKNAARYLGCDAGKEADTYISVFYDKTLTNLNAWEIFEANGDFAASRKLLYLEKLSLAIDAGKVIAAQTNYAESSRLLVSNAVAMAEAVYNNAASYDLAQITDATATLNQAIVACVSTDAATLLSGTNFVVDNAFTLSLNQLKLTDAGASISVLARNANGSGAVIDISGDNSVAIAGTSIAAASDNAQHNYQFAFNGTTVQVYRDDNLLGAAPSYTVPAYTANGTGAEWSILRASAIASYIPEVVSATAAVPQGTDVTDQYGNNCRYAVFLKNAALELTTATDYHIMQEASSLTGSTINLAHENAWLIFDNTLPSDVVNNYLASIKIKGQAAVANINVRVGIYLNGAIVMPYNNAASPFTGYSSESFAGDATALKLGANELGATANAFRSFVLKRGHMAVVASGANGSGYSRVYVADHLDIKVAALPTALNRRVSSVHIKKWNYVSKKGWCSTTGNAAVATECKKVRATWFYTWSADRASTYDTEYIPIKQHLYWPANSQINGQTNSTHALSFNEPEHSEQHTSDKCSCGGVISPWTACTKTPDLQTTGMRIGSPAPTDASWLTEYITNCNNMAYRCDFVVMHCYWGTNEAANATAWYNQLKTIYNNTKRPIWITEWNNGASWTTETWPSAYGDKLEKNRAAIKEILNVLDTCSFIERYSVYNWDSYYRAMIADDGWVTPAGQVYRDNKSTFAYNANVQFVPVWWAPALKTVELSAKINSAAGKLVFTVNNPNGDITDQLVIQRKKGDGTYEAYYIETDRSTFDGTGYTYSFDLTDFDLDSDEFRLYVTTTTGGETYSSTISLGYIVNPNIVVAAKTAVDGWSCLKSAANGFTQATGDTYLEVWDAAPGNMHFDYYQDIDNLASGVYELSAACFNSTNGVAGATVNGHVGLYAHADGIEYFAPVTTDAEYNAANRQTIPLIAVTNGKLRIGIKNLGEMTARWAGADEFKLRYVGTVEEALPQGADAFKNEMRDLSDARYKALFVWNGDKSLADATPALVNPDCARNDSYGWSVANVDFATAAAFDGVSTNGYWNKWSSAAFTSAMRQTLPFMPAGTYTASMLLRSSADTNILFYLSSDGKKTDTLTTVTGIGNTSPTGAEYINGWLKATAPAVTLQRGEKMQLGLSFTATNKWWSADRLTLQYAPLPDNPVSVVDKANLSNGLNISTDNGYIIVTVNAPTDVTVYNLAGALIARRHVHEGTFRMPLPKGIYLVNNQRVIL